MKEFVYLFCEDGLRPYRVGPTGRLIAAGQAISYRGSARHLTAVDPYTRSLYATYEDDYPPPIDPNPHPHFNGRLYQYRIRPDGSLAATNPPFITDDGDVFSPGPGRFAVFTGDALHVYRPDRRGALRLLSSTPLPNAYSVIRTPLQGGIVVDKNVRPLARVQPDGRVIPFHGPILLLSGAISPSGRTVIHEEIKGAYVQGHHPLTVYRVTPDGQADMRASTLLSPKRYPSEVAFACTDRFVYCTEMYSRGGAMSGPSPVKTDAYRILPDGHLALLPSSGVRVAGDAYPKVDPTGRFLYIIGTAGLGDGQGTLDIYRIGKDGRAVWVQSLRGFGAVGSIRFACYPVTRNSVQPFYRINKY